MSGRCACDFVIGSFSKGFTPRPAASHCSWNGFNRLDLEISSNLSPGNLSISIPVTVVTNII